MHLHIPATPAQLHALKAIRDMADVTLELHKQRAANGYCGAGTRDPIANAIRSVDRDAAEDALRTIEATARLARSTP